MGRDPAPGDMVATKDRRGHQTKWTQMVCIRWCGQKARYWIFAPQKMAKQRQSILASLGARLASLDIQLGVNKLRLISVNLPHGGHTEQK